LKLLIFSTPERAVDVMLWLVDDGGLLAFGLEHVSQKYVRQVAGDGCEERLLRLEDDSERINTLGDFLTLLAAHACHVFFLQDAPLRDLSAQKLYDLTGLDSSSTMLLGGVQK